MDDWLIENLMPYTNDDKFNQLTSTASRQQYLKENDLCCVHGIIHFHSDDDQDSCNYILPRSTTKEEFLGRLLDIWADGEEPDEVKEKKTDMWYVISVLCPLTTNEGDHDNL